MPSRTLLLAPLLAAGAGAADAACSEAEDREWLAARDGYASQPDRQADVDMLIRRRIELCAAVAAGKITQQAAERQFEHARSKVLERWGKPRDRAF